MAKLAELLSQAEVVREVKRRGPLGACEIYGDCDDDDFAAVESLRHATSWRDAQRIVDEQLGITQPIHPDKFRYHWRRHCWHWPENKR